jgi:hypothetical protein
MQDIYLNPLTHDLDLQNEQMRYITTQDEATRQRLAITLSAFKGEWFANILYGVPYLKNDNNPIELLGKGHKDLLDTEIQRTILETEGVTGMSSFSSLEDKSSRQVTITFSATTTNESIIELTVVI